MLNRKDLLNISDLSKEEIILILDKAKEMRLKVDKNELRCDKLKNSGVMTLFYENSTRTKMSFMLAVDYLGGYVEDLGVSTSSVSKGETLVDTGISIDQMGIDTIIIRHSLTGAPHIIAKNTKASVINAGDGSNEHPTQALLDMYTIREKKKNFEGLNVTIIGDIANSRVARSNIFGLTKLGANVTIAGPSTLVPKSMECLGVKVIHNIEQSVINADVIIGLRIQMERQKKMLFPSIREYQEFFRLDEKMLKNSHVDVMIMHPGPTNRGVELTTNIIDSEKSVINEQVANGVAVRMAILSLLKSGRN